MSTRESQQDTQPTLPPAVMSLPLARIDASRQADHKMRGLEMLVVAALVALIGAGAAVASGNGESADTTGAPAAAQAQVLANHGVSVGVSIPEDLNGLFELTLLNKALKAAGGEPVTAAGLGTE